MRSFAAHRILLSHSEERQEIPEHAGSFVEPSPVHGRAKTLLTPRMTRRATVIPQAGSGPAQEHSSCCKVVVTCLIWGDFGGGGS